MPRFHPVQEGTSVEVDAAIARIKRERGGKLLTLYGILLHSPPVASGWLALLTAIRQQGELSARLRELVILRIACLNRANYEFTAHVPFALEAGIDERDIEALRHDSPPPALTPLDAAVLRYAEAMTLNIEVADDVFAAVAAQLPSRQVVELTATVAAYNMVSRFLVALRIEPGGNAV